MYASSSKGRICFENNETAHTDAYASSSRHIGRMHMRALQASIYIYFYPGRKPVHAAWRALFGHAIVIER